MEPPGIPELASSATAKAALNKLSRARRFGEAAALAAKAKALWLHEAEFSAQYAQCLLAAGALSEAEAAAREALLKQPESEVLWITLADSLIRRERRQDAVDALSEACSLLPRSLALLGRLGRQAQLLEDYHKAINAFSAAAELEPEKEFWLLQQLKVLWAARRSDQAKKLIEEALRRFPESATLHCKAASFLSYERQHAAAETAARRALEFDPRMTEAHRALFGALIAQQRFGEAFRGLQSACEALDDGSLWLLLGRHAMNRSVIDLAISAFERAVALPGASANAWVQLIRALFAKKRFRDAAQQASRALLAHSTNHALAVLLAEALLHEGARTEALYPALAENLGLSEHSVAVKHAIIDALMNLGLSNEALGLLNTQDEAPDSHPETRLRFAKILMAMNAFDQAEISLKALSQEAPDWVPGLDALCETLRQQKKIKEALAVYRRIEALNPDRAVFKEIQYRMFGSVD
jgi:tetratricopeptide (TPR) repeat protein